MVHCYSDIGKLPYYFLLVCMIWGREENTTVQTPDAHYQSHPSEPRVTFDGEAGDAR